MAKTLNQSVGGWGDKSRISGAAKLRRFLRKLPGDIRQPVQDAIRDGATLIYDAAMANIPAPGAHRYATGELKRKFRVRITRDGLNAKIGSYGKRRAHHIHLVEFGTAAAEGTDKDGQHFRHAATPAMPFLFPAYKTNRAFVVSLIRTAVREAIARAARSGGKP